MEYALHFGWCDRHGWTDFFFPFLMIGRGEKLSVVAQSSHIMPVYNWICPIPLYENSYDGCCIFIGKFNSYNVIFIFNANYIFYMCYFIPYWRIFAFRIFVIYFINVKRTIWISCSTNLISFAPIDCVLEDSETGNIFSC